MNEANFQAGKSTQFHTSTDNEVQGNRPSFKKNVGKMWPVMQSI